MIRITSPAAAATIALSILLALATPARAQFNPFHGARNPPPLTNDDFRMLDDSAAKLNMDPQAHTGQIETWNNLASGASGSITIERIFRSQAMTCHALRYVISARARPGTKTYNVTWCRIPAGDWKIAG
jgi:hypothetical protein